MCNYCECEEIDKCSIIGSMPLGFCCPKCINYNEAHTCINYKMRTQDKIKSISEKIEALRGAMSEKGEEEEGPIENEEEVEEQELEKFP